MPMGACVVAEILAEGDKTRPWRIRKRLRPLRKLRVVALKMRLGVDWKGQRRVSWWCLASFPAARFIASASRLEGRVRGSVTLP